MNRIFVDTAAWIALFNRSDGLHPQAKQIMNRLKQQKRDLVTTEFILLEVADAFADPPMRILTIEYLNRLRYLSDLRIVPASSDLFEEGWALYGQRLDKGWGLTDCISFVVMRQEGITQVFTSDRHFEQAGFAKLM